MKAAANGALNVSILDGWWCEGYAPDTGGAIGRGEGYEDPEEQDQVEGEGLYSLLEEEIVPLLYARDRAGSPSMRRETWGKAFRPRRLHAAKAFAAANSFSPRRHPAR